MKKSAKNLIQIHTAVLLFGLAGLFGKLVAQSPVIIVLGRVFFASVILGLILAYRKQTIKLHRSKDYLFLFLLGVILAVHWITFFKAIQVSTVAVGLLTFSTFPVFVTFLEPWFFKERIRFGDILIALVTFGGVALVVPKFTIGNSVTQGALWGTASGFTFAILAILNRKYIKTYSSLVIAFYQDAAATVVLFPIVFIVLPVFAGYDLFLLILLGVVFTGIAHSLFINGMQSIKAQTASILSCLEPVYGIIAAVVLLNEIPSLRVLAGGIIILTTTLFATVKSSKNE